MKQILLRLQKLITRKRMLAGLVALCLGLIIASLGIPSNATGEPTGSITPGTSYVSFCGLYGRPTEVTLTATLHNGSGKVMVGSTQNTNYKFTSIPIASNGSTPGVVTWKVREQDLDARGSAVTFNIKRDDNGAWVENAGAVVYRDDRDCNSGAITPATNYVSSCGLAVRPSSVTLTATLKSGSGKVVVSSTQNTSFNFSPLAVSATSPATWTVKAEDLNAAGSAVTFAIKNDVGGYFVENAGAVVYRDDRDCNSGDSGVEQIACDAQGNVPEAKAKQLVNDKILVSVNGGSASVRNNTNCKLPVSLASYQMFDRQLATQKLFDATGVVTVASGQSANLSVSLPNCMAQIDLYYGAPLQTLDNANSGAGKVLGWAFYQNNGGSVENASGPFCGEEEKKPQLVIEKNGPATASLNGNVAFSIKVSNPGQASAKNVYVVDAFPSDFTYVSVSGANCMLQSGNQIKCQIGELSVGQSKNFTLNFKVKDSRESCGQFTNTATAYADGGLQAVDTASGQVECQDPQLVCAPANQTVDINQAANFTATGGNGQYAWTASNGTPNSGSESSFSTKYSAAGSRTVTVKSGTQTASCAVKVEVEELPELVCAPSSQSVKIGQVASFVATGGNGQYAWTASNGTPNTGSSNTFQTKYSSAGTKSVTVASAGKTKTCSVTVEDYPKLTCAPASQSVRLGQAASFVATGGNGQYAWTASNGTPNTGTGSTFSSTYNTTGNKQVVVASAGQTASCQVSITEIPQELVCAPSNQSVDVDQLAAFVASGGTGQYSWSATAGTPSSGTGATFSTKYTSSGSKTVRVTSGNKTASCQVVVRDVTLNCSPDLQYADLNQSVSLVATGGNGNFVWTTPGANTGNQTGSQVSVSFSSSGTKNVTVTSAGKSDTCQVVVRETSSGTTLSIEKLVRNVTRGGDFTESLSNVQSGDTLEYQIRIRNTGSYPATSVMLKDFLSSTGVLENLREISSTMLYTGTFPNQISFNYALASNQQITVTYKYTVRSGIAYNTRLCNVATTWANQIGQVTDQACLYGDGGGQPNLVLSKTAFNNTKNVDATSQAASIEDYITYTLTVRNNSFAQAFGYVITDDLSGVLPLADMVDLGGGQLIGNTLSYPAVNIAANSSVSKSFKVRVKYHLSSSISYQMLNTFGNTVTIVINPPKPYIPPKTGGLVDLLGGLGLASMVTAAYAYNRKRSLKKA